MKQIKEGRYFADAREWYSLRYLSPIPERSLLIFITILSVVAGSVAGMTSYSMFPVVMPYEVIIKVDDSIDNFSVIKRLSVEGLTTRQAVAKYLLENYVATRETYNYLEFDPQFRRMREASSKKVYREFQTELSTSNPNSRTVNYGKYTTRSVQILSSAFAEEGRYTEKAAVIFETTVIGNKGEKSVERWGAHLSYTLGDINKIVQLRKEGLPFGNRLEFIVTNYKVQKLS